MRVVAATISITALALWLLAGCNGTAATEPLVRQKAERQLFSIDFEQARTLRYKFISQRHISIDFGSAKSTDKSGLQNATEQMELVMSYTPTEVSRYGFATIQATCESAKVMRSSVLGEQDTKDAVTSLKGKSFRLKVTPGGVVEDRSELKDVVNELGEKAFSSPKTRIKDPDMILDFVATQWFLWDAFAKIKRPRDGVALGESWSSKLSVPLPVPMLKARDMEYSFSELRQTEAGRMAVIKSTYSLAEHAEPDWPMPYGGSFQMRGMFGFLRGYKVLKLEGTGVLLFNLDAGRIESDHQQYEVEVSAAMPFGLGQGSGISRLKPNMIIKQEISMQLLED